MARTNWNFGEVILQAMENRARREQENARMAQDVSQFSEQMAQRKTEFTQNHALAQTDQDFRTKTVFPWQKSADARDAVERVREFNINDQNAKGYLGVQQGYFGLAKDKWDVEIGGRKAIGEAYTDVLRNDPDAALRGILNTNPVHRAMVLQSMAPMLSASAKQEANLNSKVETTRTMEGPFGGYKYTGEGSWLDRFNYKATNAFARLPVLGAFYDTKEKVNELNPTARHYQGMGRLLDRVLNGTGGDTQTGQQMFKGVFGNGQLTQDQLDELMGYKR